MRCRPSHLVLVGLLCATVSLVGLPCMQHHLDDGAASEQRAAALAAVAAARDRAETSLVETRGLLKASSREKPVIYDERSESHKYCCS